MPKLRKIFKFCRICCCVSQQVVITESKECPTETNNLEGTMNSVYVKFGSIYLKDVDDGDNLSVARNKRFISQWQRVRCSDWPSNYFMLRYTTDNAKYASLSTSMVMTKSIDSNANASTQSSNTSSQVCNEFEPDADNRLFYFWDERVKNRPCTFLRHLKTGLYVTVKNGNVELSCLPPDQSFSQLDSSIW